MKAWGYLVVLEAHDLLDGLNLNIARHLGSAGVTHIQQFSPVRREISQRQAQ